MRIAADVFGAPATPPLLPPEPPALPLLPALELPADPPPLSVPAVPPAPPAPPLPLAGHVALQRLHTSPSATRLDAQHAHAHTLVSHEPMVGIALSSLSEQVH
jgi:hypothetical protein